MPQPPGSSAMTRPRAVIFDMDGLMFNTEDVYWHVGSELLRRRGHVYTKAMSDAMMGRTPQAAFEILIDRYGLSDDWRGLADESEAVFVELLTVHLEMMPGLETLLDALDAAGIPKAIGTSSARRLADKCLSRFDLHRRFAAILTAEDIVRGKPDPEIYLRAAERLQVPPAETVILEDSHVGCRAAAAAGAFVVAVPAAHSRNHDFSAASMIAEGLADLRLYELLEIAGD